MTLTVFTGKLWALLNPWLMLSHEITKDRTVRKRCGHSSRWVVRQIGHIMVWLGRQAKQAVNFIFGTSETFVERMRTLVVVLEFWNYGLFHFSKHTRRK